MVHNHDHSGVKWGGGSKYAEGGGETRFAPPSCATDPIPSPLIPSSPSLPSLFYTFPTHPILSIPPRFIPYLPYSSHPLHPFPLYSILPLLFMYFIPPHIWGFDWIIRKGETCGIFMRPIQKRFYFRTKADAATIKKSTINCWTDRDQILCGTREGLWVVKITKNSSEEYCCEWDMPDYK